MPQSTVLIAVVTNSSDSRAMAQWLTRELPTPHVARARGYHAAVAAVEQGVTAVIADVGTPAGREDWRLAELRSRRPEATLVVVAEAAHLTALTSMLGADLAVTTVEALPPLREVLVGDEPRLADDQTNWRRSRR
jgi:hypothetical protein